MKHIYIVVLYFLSAFTSSKAQTAAMDWTKNDCRNNQAVNLFSLLDSNYVIVQEYVMVGCSPCNVAGDGLKNILQTFNISHPGRVKFFQTVFDKGVTKCADLVFWADTSGYQTSMLFDQGYNEMLYYQQLVQMPVVVILGGGKDHKVYYNQFGYSPLDDNMITYSIHMALLPTDIKHTPDAAHSAFVYPNPAEETLHIRNNTGIKEIQITSIAGRTACNYSLSGIKSEVAISLSAIPAGLYLVKVTDVTGRTTIEKIIKE